jgi:hypothetical protein
MFHLSSPGGFAYVHDRRNPPVAKVIVPDWGIKFTMA